MATSHDTGIKRSLARQSWRHVLLPLPYEHGALEPYIDGRTRVLHHDRHHAAVAFLLVDHRWARELLDVIDEEGSALLGYSGFLAPELGLVVDAELAAMEQAARSIAAAQAAETADEAVARDREAVRASDEQAADARMAASVTPAEIRVLRYLPTKLSFALIADKLGISRGAARSRAERAYKKLGVHNRADAVDRARTLRMVT